MPLLTLYAGRSSKRALIKKCFNFQTPASLSGGSHNNLLANYRPLACSKPLQSQFHRLSKIAMKSRKEIPPACAMPTLPSRISEQSSGRISQLAGSVEHLVLQVSTGLDRSVARH